MTQMTMSSKRSILVINPNSNSAMTDALKPLVASLGFNETTIHFFTAPSGPSSINNEDDAAESAKHCMPALKTMLADYSGFLVACYSQHPLVPQLKDLPNIKHHKKPVTGIFEASLSTSLQLIHPRQTVGIVTTGKVWESILTEATEYFLGAADSKRFSGVETTGLNAGDLHDAPHEEVERRMKEATKRLLRKGDVGAICLGCAGMAGLGEMVRDACVEEKGEEGKLVRVVDGVVAGVAWLEGVLRTDF